MRKDGLPLPVFESDNGGSDITTNRKEMCLRLPEGLHFQPRASTCARLGAGYAVAQGQILLNCKSSSLGLVGWTNDGTPCFDPGTAKVHARLVPERAVDWRSYLLLFFRHRDDKVDCEDTTPAPI